MEEVSENSFTLTWKAPEQMGQAGLDGYVVEICKDGSRFGLSCLVSMERLCMVVGWRGAGWNPAEHFPLQQFLFFPQKDVFSMVIYFP